MAQRKRVNRIRRRTLIWTAGLVAFVSTMLYWEQAAILYVVSTIAVVALLMIVGLSDLERKDKEFSRELEDEVRIRSAAAERSAPATRTLPNVSNDRQARANSQDR